MAHPEVGDVRLLADDPGQVQDVARRVVGSPTATLRNWSVASLPGGAGGNPTSAGIHRVSGQVQDGAAVASWSAILKIVRSPVETGEPWDDPGDAIYWRREVEAFSSGLLEDVEGVVPPRCYGLREWQPATAWLWLEDVGTLRRASWGPAEYRTAARALAQFHAPYLAGRSLPDAQWLNREYLRGFHDYLQPWFGPLMARARATTGPLGGLDPGRADPNVAMVLAVVTDPTRLLAALDEAPKALCHNDTHIDNMLVRAGPRGPEVVVLDWQMVGPGPIGSDLGQLLCEIPETSSGGSGAAAEEAVLRAYHEELRRCGVRLELAAVRQAQSADALVRQAHWLVLLLCLRLAEVAPGDDESVARMVEEFQRGLSTSRLPRLASQVRDLLPR